MPKIPTNFSVIFAYESINKQLFSSLQMKTSASIALAIFSRTVQILSVVFNARVSLVIRETDFNAKVGS